MARMVARDNSVLFCVLQGFKSLVKDCLLLEQEHEQWRRALRGLDARLVSASLIQQLACAHGTEGDVMIDSEFPQRIN